MSDLIKKCPKRLFFVVQTFPIATNSVNNIFSLSDPNVLFQSCLSIHVLLSQDNGYSLLYLMQKKKKKIQTRNNMNAIVCVFSTVTAGGCVLTLFISLFCTLWCEHSIIYRLVREIFHILCTGSVCLYFLDVYFHADTCKNIHLMWKWCSEIAEHGSRLTVDPKAGRNPLSGPD